MSPFKTFWNKRMRVSYTLIAVAALLAFSIRQSSQLKASKKNSQAKLSACPPAALFQYRMSEYKYARPLLITDILNNENAPSAELRELRGQLLSIIESKKTSGEITSASIYVRTLKNGQWVSVNENEDFKPASLGKVPMMLALLRQSELNPGFLNKQVLYDKKIQATTYTYFPDDMIKTGRKYSIKELLTASIEHSDNDATDLLVQQLDKEVFKRLFASLDLPDPALDNREFQLNAIEYSKFMRVLYNATYLSNEDADWALSLLAKSTFMDGMRKGVPQNIEIARKFGESGEKSTAIDKQFHESGIIYIEGNPILVTIMTKGKDIMKLPPVVTELSRVVYKKLSGV